MTIVYVTSDTVGSGVQATVAINGDLVIDNGVLVGSTDNDAVQALGGFQEVLVLGTVSGNFDGIQLGDDLSLDRNNVVRVAAGGVVYGTIGVSLASHNSQLINDGDIYASTGAFVGGIGDFASTVVNRGTITGNFGVVVNTNATELVVMTNHGSVVATGTGQSYRGAANPDIVLNRGIMEGDIDLGAGNDLYDGRRGTIEGDIFGGDGDDTFLPGLSDEDIFGGSGIDTLDFRGSAGLRVSLADDSGTGLAAGDTYTSISKVLGSRGGADTLVGDGANNTLESFGGNDTLQGGAGNDTLSGGIGVDTLTGGANNDSFTFEAPDTGGDLILDFSNTSTNNDRFRIDASEFGGGLTTGSLAASEFRARADNVAQDADDRFVFRTTDATLWFDADGSGSSAAVLVADLQAGAVLTSADILLI